MGPSCKIYRHTFLQGLVACMDGSAAGTPAAFHQGRGPGETDPADFPVRQFTVNDPIEIVSSMDPENFPIRCRGRDKHVIG
jgi:hypothetical protein